MAKLGAQTTTDEVLAGVDLSGKRILITGVSAGLGVETARSLASRGATVVGAARDITKAQSATKGVVEGDFTLLELDLASLESVRRCTHRLSADGRPFDIIIANAGVMATPEGRTADGFETQFGTNHLGHFVLVNRLASMIRDGGRLVNLSSMGHRRADVNLDDPNFQTEAYDPWIAYGRSKTANILFAVEFDRRHRARGIRAAAVHPGGIATELGRYMTDEARAALVASINPEGAEPFRYKSVQQGAATTVWASAVASGDEVGGLYCEDCHVAEVIDDPAIRRGVRPYALDPAHAEALWCKSEELVGERF